MQYLAVPVGDADMFKGDLSAGRQGTYAASFCLLHRQFHYGPDPFIGKGMGLEL